MALWRNPLKSRSSPAAKCGAIFCSLVLVTLATSANSARPVRRVPDQPKAVKPVTLQSPAPAAHGAAVSGFARLAPVEIYNINTRQRLSAKLYDASGMVDEATASRLDALLCDSRNRKHWQSTHLDRRTLQLVYRAAYHFHADTVQVVSAYRKAARRREGTHAQGKAVDFRIPEVDAVTLAAYLRTIPRVGVGVYTHPKTQFVHLDVREHSYHWLDASPPRRHWRERNVSSKTLAELDAKYSPSADWPEGLAAPAVWAGPASE